MPLRQAMQVGRFCRFGTGQTLPWTPPDAPAAFTQDPQGSATPLEPLTLPSSPPSRDSLDSTDAPGGSGVVHRQPLLSTGLC